MYSVFHTSVTLGSVSSPLCVCENWKGYVVKHNYVSLGVLMAILDNYMFRPLLAIFRLSSLEDNLKIASKGRNM